MKKNYFIGVLVIAAILIGACYNPFFPPAKEKESGTQTDGGSSLDLNLPNIESGVDIGSVIEGEEPDPFVVTITNNGDEPTGDLTITLSGEDSDKFTIDPDTLDSIDPGDSDSFTIIPDDDLEEGTYTATVTIKDDDGEVLVEFEITFTVNAPTFTVTYNDNGSDSGTAPQDPDSLYSRGSTVTVLGNIDLVKADHDFIGWSTGENGSGDHYIEGDTFDITENTTFYARWKLRLGISLCKNTHLFDAAAYGYMTRTPYEVTVTNTNTSAATGVLDISIDIESDNPDDFELSSLTIASIPAGEEGSFTIVPKYGFAYGHYSADITVSGAEGITASISVSFNVTRKEITIATVTPLAKTYDGTASATAGAVTFSGLVGEETLTADIDYTVSVEFTGGNYSYGSNKSYTYTVTLQSTDKAKNYTLPVNTKNGEDGTINCAHGDSDWVTAVEPTCTTVGTKELQCTICNFVLDIDVDSIPVLDHTFSPTTPATCIAGSIPGTCSSCGMTNPELVVLALGHTPGTAATCTADQICTVCDDVLAVALGHDGTWTVTNTVYPATSTGTCSRCSLTTRTTQIGDIGPGGGIIFFVADGVGFLADNTTPKPLGFTLFMTAADTVGTTAYYLEAGTVVMLGGTGAETTMRSSIRTGAPYPTLNIADDASGWSIGTGKRNTAIIIAVEEAERPGGNTYIYAALACDNYRTAVADDWFLPSRDELNELYKERAQFGISSGTFSSSSQANTLVLWNQSFSSGRFSYFSKATPLSVRAVRAF